MNFEPYVSLALKRYGNVLLDPALIRREGKTKIKKALLEELGFNCEIETKGKSQIAKVVKENEKISKQINGTSRKKRKL